MDRFEPFLSLGLALVVGLLIGFEREQSAPESARNTSFVGGARTHPLVALVGALSMLLARATGYFVVGLALAGILALLGLAYFDDVRRGRDRGITSEIAFVLTFLLGALATAEHIIEPLSHRAIVLASTAVLATVLLGAKPPLHRLAQRTSKADVFATLKFLIAAVVVLPLLPNRTYGPLDVLNPYSIGLMVVLIAGIDFVGYVAVRALGAGRGLGLTGLIGGLASSTAVTLSMAHRAKSDPELTPPCALAVVTASTVMFPRVLLEVAVVHRPLVDPLLAPLVAMTLGGALGSVWLLRRSRRGEKSLETIQIDNPFELTSALKWGLLFTLVLFASKLATVYLGSRGTYLAGLLAGTTDVDAITLSMSKLAKEGLDSTVAVTTIVIGASANTLVKGAMATVVGGWQFGRQVLAAVAATLLAGAVAVGTLWM